MSVLRFALQPGCLLLPYDTVAGRCARCGNSLLGQKRRWCSLACEKDYQRNHYWQVARQAAVKRDGNKCIRCGWLPESCGYLGNGQLVLWTKPCLTLEPDNNWLEVNHIIPRRGGGYGNGCHHHLATLETLCHRCHVKVTRRQRYSRLSA